MAHFIEYYFEGLGTYYTNQNHAGLWCLEDDPGGRHSVSRIFWPHEFSVAQFTTKRARAIAIRHRLSDEYESKCVAAYVAEGLGES